MAQSGLVDGSRIKALVQDDRAFGKLIEDKFRALNRERNGTLSPQELQPVVLAIGAALGLPPKGSNPDTDRVYDQVLGSFLDHGNRVTKERFAVVFRDMLLGLADGLAREPVKVISLDGKKLAEYAQSSDAEVSAVSTFVELDTESSGKIQASNLRKAMNNVSVAHGAPPPEENSNIFEIALQRAGVDEGELINQIQFVELFKRVLLEVSRLLDEKPLTIAHMEKVFDGKSVRAFLSDKNSAIKEILNVWRDLPKDKHGKITIEGLVYAMDALAPKVGLPPYGAIEEMDAEIRSTFKMIESNNNLIDKEMYVQNMREVLGALMLQLEGKPIAINTSSIVKSSCEDSLAALI